MHNKNFARGKFIFFTIQNSFIYSLSKNPFFDLFFIDYWKTKVKGKSTAMEAPHSYKHKMILGVNKIVRIFIDPGHGGADPGATGFGLVEKNLTLQIAKEIDRILNDEYDGVITKMSRTGDQTVTLSERTNAANRWNADFYLSLHINAGGGTGFESFIYPSVPLRTKKIQQDIHNEILRFIDLKNRGMKTANFHVLRETKMDALLTENGFIDNMIDAKKLKSKDFLHKIAQGHAAGIAIAFNLKKKKNDSGKNDPPTKSRESLYKVQIGAFKEKTNADALAQKAKQKNFDVFIKQEKNLYKVQIGAFRERKNAEALSEQAKKAGFDTYIVME